MYTNIFFSHRFRPQRRRRFAASDTMPDVIDVRPPPPPEIENPQAPVEHYSEKVNKPITIRTKWEIKL